jgi:hypothetical protein
LAVLAIAVSSFAGVTLAGIAPASAVGVPVVIDNFAGQTLGTRTVTLLPTSTTSTTSPGTFSQSGGIATMTMNGSGNTAGGVELDYQPSSPVDLTGGGTDTQFFLQASEIVRSDDAKDALNLSISVMSSNGVTGVYSTGIGNTYADNVVLNFDCSVNPVCFDPQPNFTEVTNVEILLLYPQNYDSAQGVTTVELNGIVATPTGGEVPPPPSPSFNATSPQVTVAGGSANFPVTFISDGTPDAVTNDPPSTTGLSAEDVQVTTTSSNTLTATVTGGPASYNIAVTGMTSDQNITVTIPAGVVTDAWSNNNLAGSATVQYIIKANQAVSFTSTPPVDAPIGGSTYTPTATASSALAVTITVDPSSTGCQMSPAVNGTVSFTARGTCVIDANQAGNGGYFAAPEVQQRIAVDQPPTVSSVRPDIGPITGGTTITITGINFLSGSTVAIGQGGGTPAVAARDVDVVSLTEITAVTGGGAKSGTYDVHVTSSLGESEGSPGGAFTYVGPPTVSSVSPDIGPRTGGTEITITGTNFLSGSTVAIGQGSGTPEVAASDVDVVSLTEITAVTGGGAEVGTYDVYVRTGAGSSAGNSKAAFTYVGAPTVTSVSPGVGPKSGGTKITITGTNFLSGASVAIGQGLSGPPVAATEVDVVSLTEITALTGAAKVGTYDVYVTTAVGTSAGNSKAAFTYVGAPTVSSVSPGVGPKSGGTKITITGTNFLSGASVAIGQGLSGPPVAATDVDVVSLTEITAITGGGAKVGTYDVYVTTAAGTAGGNSKTRFTYAAAPTVTSVSPNAGPKAGGTEITIMGTNFLPGATVAIGQGLSGPPVAATDVDVVSSSKITARTGAGKVGTYDVYVTTPGGTNGGRPNRTFTYVARPTVTNVGPNNGPFDGGTTIDISGTGFAAGATVMIGEGKDAFPLQDVVVIGANQISGITPASGVTGSFYVYVTTPDGGTSAANAGAIFTYTSI